MRAGADDERLTLVGNCPRRICIVRNVEVKTGGKYAFSISDDDLRDCTK